MVGSLDGHFSKGRGGDNSQFTGAVFNSKKKRNSELVVSRDDLARQRLKFKRLERIINSGESKFKRSGESKAPRDLLEALSDAAMCCLALDWGSKATQFLSKCVQLGAPGPSTLPRLPRPRLHRVSYVSPIPPTRGASSRASTLPHLTHIYVTGDPLGAVRLSVTLATTQADWKRAEQVHFTKDQDERNNDENAPSNPP